MIQTDVLVVGAGPCGLFQVFELGLLGLKAHVIESLDKAGGQCAELYPDKPIYDIPALPVCGALELVERLQEQIKPFDASFHFMCEARTVKSIEGRFQVTTSTEATFDVGAIVIAAGAGSFQPIPLKAVGMDVTMENRRVYYQIRKAEHHYGKRLMILGGGDSALDWALSLQPHAQSVHVVHRSDTFRAQPASIQKMMNLCDAGVMQHTTGSVTKIAETDKGVSVEITVREESYQQEVDEILCFYGLSPKLGPIGEWGLEKSGHHLVVDTEKFQTSQQGIFAIGDVNSYPGKKKLILSGFHEAALAAFAIKKQLFPEQKLHLQYTTTSPVMKQRLGVD